MKRGRKFIKYIPILAVAILAMGQFSSCSNGWLSIHNTDVDCTIRVVWVGTQSGAATVAPSDSFSLLLPNGNYSFTAKIVEPINGCTCSGEIGAGTFVMSNNNPAPVIWVQCNDDP